MTNKTDLGFTRRGLLGAFAATMVGFGDVAVYDSSLSEWAADPSLPMEIG